MTWLAMWRDEGALAGSLPPQQAAKSFEQKLDSPMAGSVTAERPLNVGRTGGRSGKAKDDGRGEVRQIQRAAGQACCSVRAMKMAVVEQQQQCSELRYDLDVRSKRQQRSWRLAI